MPGWYRRVVKAPEAPRPIPGISDRRDYAGPDGWRFTFRYTEAESTLAIPQKDRDGNMPSSEAQHAWLKKLAGPHPGVRQVGGVDWAAGSSDALASLESEVVRDGRLSSRGLSTKDHDRIEEVLLAPMGTWTSWSAFLTVKPLGDDGGHWSQFAIERSDPAGPFTVAGMVVCTGPSRPSGWFQGFLDAEGIGGVGLGQSQAVFQLPVVMKLVETLREIAEFHELARTAYY